MIAGFASFLTDTLVWTGVLIAAVLVLRRPVARLFGPGMSYALWLLPLLRFALPPIPLPADPASRRLRARSRRFSPGGGGDRAEVLKELDHTIANMAKDAG